jgi:hypothetical protein
MPVPHLPSFYKTLIFAKFIEVGLVEITHGGIPEHGNDIVRIIQTLSKVIDRAFQIQ